MKKIYKEAKPWLKGFFLPKIKEYLGRENMERDYCESIESYEGVRIPVSIVAAFAADESDMQQGIQYMLNDVCQEEGIFVEYDGPGRIVQFLVEALFQDREDTYCFELEVEFTPY